MKIIKQNYLPQYLLGLIIIMGLFIFWNKSKIFNKLEKLVNLEPKSKLNIKYKGICVFDLDDTLTCGFDNAKAAIYECKINECKIAINTARPAPYYRDIKLKKLGLEKSDFEGDIYYGDWIRDMVSSISYEKIMEKVVSTKVKHLKTLENKYNISDRKKIILFDDHIGNIKGARDAGFSVIHANSVACGLPEDVGKQIRDIINN